MLYTTLLKGVDRTFGIYDESKKLHIGDKPIVIKDDNIIVGDEEYEGTKGLWELIMLVNPQNYNNDDLKNYERLLLKTNAIHRNNDPENPYPKASPSDKWKNIIAPIWYEKASQKKQEKKKLRQQELQERQKERKKTKTKGKGVAVIIPEDPNALLERLELLLSSHEVGHTGVGNELVSICDELKRQGVINADTYKKLNSYIKI